ncbi:two-component system regulatory protein YycI [Lacticaseibacillus brantae]|uniref:Regulatory protein YycH-like domain-containing protein n=1 Tax=Lacticaseibacillus brantae DSM 23927 TaxID=1423727 RepID=A0A0R2B7Z8_9LACO|nr:two-component system regulatory protein YycI [Lacticaseibacillus brantae]KRM71628.1 hypothetical protein FC34_GL001285 [Lacticaseibacillus brantae DSM 23927]
MDFRRIEWIFLVVFIALDIFLGYSIYQSQQAEPVSTAPDVEIMQEIKRDQISLPKLSSKTPKGAFLAAQPNTDLYQQAKTLTGQRVTFDDTRTKLSSTLVSPLAVKKSPQDTLADWMKTTNNVLFGDQYVYAPELSSKDIVAFAQKINAGRVYDDRAVIYFKLDNNRLVSYTQTYITKPEQLRNLVNLVSNEDAVSTLYRDNEIPNNSRVLWTRLAYTWLLDAKGSTVYVPAWYVGIENKTSKNVTIKRVNAMTDAVIKTRTDS